MSLQKFPSATFELRLQRAKHAESEHMGFGTSIFNQNASILLFSKPLSPSIYACQGQRDHELARLEREGVLHSSSI